MQRTFSYWTSIQERLGFTKSRCGRLRRTAIRNFRRQLHFETLEDRQMLALLTVDSPLDNTTSDGLITLREAIIAANSDTVADAMEGTQAGSGADRIEFDAAVFGGSPVTILLSQGVLSISSDLTIVGPGTDQLTIDASGNDPTPNSLAADDNFTHPAWVDPEMAGSANAATLTASRGDRTDSRTVVPTSLLPDRALTIDGSHVGKKRSAIIRRDNVPLGGIQDKAHRIALLSLDAAIKSPFDSTQAMHIDVGLNDERGTEEADSDELPVTANQETISQRALDELFGS